MVISQESTFGFIAKTGIFLWAVVKPHFHMAGQCARKTLNALGHRCPPALPGDMSEKMRVVEPW